MSRFLSRLDMEWKLSTDNLERAEIRARQAGYLARVGEFDKSKAIVGELRKEFGDGRSGRVTVWIIISEALIHHYEKLDLIALDRVTRAQLLSRMMRDKRLEAIASAWRAHIEFDHSKFDEMFVSLQSAIRCAEEGNNDALSRIANIVCKTAMLCGETQLAQSQFLIGREYALRDGDQAGVEALQHNRASFRLARIRSAKCFGEVEANEIRETRVEIETARSLQNLAGVTALSSYIDLCHARLLVVEGRFVEAIDRLNDLKGVGPFPAESFHYANLDLEIAYCYCATGKLDQAFGILGGQEFVDIDALDVDEQLVIRWIQLQLSKQDSRFGPVDDYRKLLESTVIEYIKLMTKLRGRLGELSWN